MPVGVDCRAERTSPLLTLLLIMPAGTGPVDPFCVSCSCMVPPPDSLSGPVRRCLDKRLAMPGPAAGTPLTTPCCAAVEEGDEGHGWDATVEGVEPLSEIVMGVNVSGVEDSEESSSEQFHLLVSKLLARFPCNDSAWLLPAT